MLRERRPAFERELEFNFLYQNDPDAMHLLLSLLENKSSYINLRPKYTCTVRVLKRLKREFRKRRDAEFVIQTFRKVVNDDLNRIDLAIYIKGYEWGYRSSHWTDMLERMALRKVSMDTLYYDRILFHSSDDPDILTIKQSAFTLINRNEKDNHYFKRVVGAYLEEMVKDKIFHFNDHFDRQIALDLDRPGGYIYAGEMLSEEELQRAYKIISQSLYEGINQVFKKAAWYGINDAVLNRYR